MSVNVIKTSVIVSTVNRRDLVLRLLENLAAQTQLPDEIILIEAGGAAWLSEDAPPVLRGRFLIFYAPQESLAASRERGRKLAHGDILIFLDDDVIVPLTYVGEAVNYLTANDRIMGVGGAYTDSTTKNRSSATVLIGRILGIYADGSCNKILRSGWADYVRWPFSTEISSAQWLFGCNSVIRAKAFDNPGIRYPIEMLAWSFLEDVFIGASLTQSFGECLYILPSLSIIHAPTESAGRMSKATLRMRILYRWIFWRDCVPNFFKPSLCAFSLGLVANLLLMFKQEQRLWVVWDNFKTWVFIVRNPRMNWEIANEFILSKN
jgi:glucosyl-dolichyl phosphate glucuronosyltransferase